MYKNFKLTEKERQQILEQHKSRGYKQPLNKNADNSLDINEAERSPVKSVINNIFRKNGIKKVTSYATSVSGFRTYEGSGYEYNYGGSVSFHKIPEEVIKDLANQMKAAGVKDIWVYDSSIDFNNRELKTSDESMNEESTGPNKEQVFMLKFFNGPIENFEDEIENLFQDAEQHFISYDGIDGSYYRLLKMVVNKIESTASQLRAKYLEREPSDDDIFNQPGSEGGVSYKGGDNFQGR